MLIEEHTRTVQGYTLEIHTDDDPESPRDWDNLGHMICFHSKYNLGDKHDHKDPNAFYLSLIPELTDLTLSCIFDWCLNEKYTRENFYHYFGLEPYQQVNYDDTGRQEFIDFLLDEFQYEIPQEVLDLILDNYPGAALALYLYDHSGITMSTSPFSCPWDSGQVGYIYVSEDEIKEEWGKTHDISDEVKQYLKGEVETYDQYLRNDVYGFLILADDGRSVDGCWGFYGLEAVKVEAAKALDHFVETDTAKQPFLESTQGAD